MADLGQLALQIVADPTGFEVGLTRAAGRMSSFVGTVQNSMQTIEQSMKALAANPLGAVLMALGKFIELAQAAKTVTMGWLAELGKMASEGAKAGMFQEKLTRRFGLSAEGAGTLAHLGNVMGLDTETMTTSLQAFTVRLGDASHAGGPVEQALHRIGLTARELTQIPLDQAMRRIGEQLRGIENPAERTVLMHEILGRRAMELEKIVSRGGDTWDRAGRQARDWGLIQDAATARAIRSAAIAQRTAEIAERSIRQGLGNALAGAAAPVLEAWANVKIAIIDLAQGPLGMLRDGIRTVGTWFGAVLDGIKTGWKELEPTWIEVKAQIDDAWQAFKDATGSSEDFRQTLRGIAAFITANLGPVLKSVGFYAVGAVMNAIAAYQLLRAQLESVMNAIRTAVSGVASAIEVLLEMGANLPARLGGNEFRTLLDNFRGLRGNVEQFLGGLRLPGINLADALRPPPPEQIADLRNWAETWDDVMNRVAAAVPTTPLENFRDAVSELDELMAMDVITADEYARGLGRAFDQLEHAQHRHDAGLPGAISVGSSQAISFINQANATSPAQDPQQQTVQLLRAANERDNQRAIWEREVRDAVVSGRAFQAAGLSL
jgi:hypothetical protein